MTHQDTTDERTALEQRPGQLHADQSPYVCGNDDCRRVLWVRLNDEVAEDDWSEFDEFCQECNHHSTFACLDDVDLPPGTVALDGDGEPVVNPDWPHDQPSVGDCIPASVKPLVGEETVHVVCQSYRVDAGCDGWEGDVDLDSPAYYVAEDERVYLPGFEEECPECGNTVFSVEGVVLTFNA